MRKDMTTFADYSGMPDVLSMEEFQIIHEAMIASMGDDEDAWELYDELMEYAVEYANIRAGWFRMSREERREADEGRTRTHDTLISKFNQLARYLENMGQDITWREKLGYTEENPYHRKRIGDMGCWLAFVAGIISR